MSGAVWRLLTGLWAGCLAGGAWLAWAGTRPETDPVRWDMRPSPVVLQVADLAGELRPRPDALELRSYEGVSPRLPPAREASVHARVRLPEGAQLLVRFGAALARSGPQAPQGRAPRDPARDETGAAVVLDAARGDVYGIGLSCVATAPLTERDFDLGVVAGQGTVIVTVDGAERARCAGAWGAGAVVLASGVRTVGLDDVRVEAGGARIDDAFGGFARTPTAGVLLGVLAFLLGVAQGGRAGPSRGLALAGAPWVAVLPLAVVNVEGTLQALRIVALPAAAGPLVLAAPFGVGGLVVWAAVRGRAWAIVAALLPALLLGGLGLGFG